MAKSDIRNLVSFRADFPEDTDPSYPEGIVLAEYLVEQLQTAGYTCTEPDNYEDFAWWFDCKSKGRTFFMLVGLLDDGPRQWLLTADSTLGFISRLRRINDRSEHQELCLAVHRVLESDTHFSEVRWYTASGWDNDADTLWSDEPIATEN